MSEVGEAALQAEASILPVISLEYKVEVDGELEITDQDYINLKIIITQENYDKGLKYAHLNRYEGFKEARWHVIVGNEKKEILFY